jgi:ABC-2 type transport system permease protein
MLILFGLIYAGNNNQSKSFDATAPGILIGAALFFSCLGGTTALIVGERERLTLNRILITPMKPISYFLGIVLAQMVIGFFQTIVVYGTAFLFGGRIYGSVWLVMTIITMSIIAFVGLGFVFGATFAKRTEDVNGPVSAIGVPLLVLGGTFFPVSILPGYLLVIAKADPIFHMNQALKLVSAKGAAIADISTYFIFLVLFSVASIIAGVYFYHRLLHSIKKS